MALRYRVAHGFTHESHYFTNSPSDLKAIKELPRKVRDHHIERGNLVEWDDRVQDAPPAPGEEE